jgi:hypothetical protein
MNRLARIGLYLIPRHFPELQRETILFQIQESKEWELCYDPDIRKGNHHIKCTPRYVILPRPIIVGGIAHELSHMVHDVPFFYAGTLMAQGRTYNTNKKARTREERETDERVIQRGLGNELLASAEWQLKKQEGEWYPDNGLHPDEIRTLLASQQRNGILKTLPKHYSTWRARR